MNVNLMFKDSDFATNSELCFAYDTLKTDFELRKVLDAMSKEDEVIYASCETALFTPLKSLVDISYRQENLKDALGNSTLVRKLYQAAYDTVLTKSKMWNANLRANNLNSTVYNAVRLLELYIDNLENLRLIVDADDGIFKSEGFSNLLAQIQEEFSSEYCNKARDLLGEVRNKSGTFIEVKLGSYLQGINYTLIKKGKLSFRGFFRNVFSYTPEGGDNAGTKEMNRKYSIAINDAANALAQSADHLEAFFRQLRDEMAFYVGCLNLGDFLSSVGMEYCIPTMLPLKGFTREYTDLYDVGLVLMKKSKVDVNTFRSEDKHMYIITGVNQGGKTTFVRSMGQAQMMGQCGMLVGASSYSSSIVDGVYSHFRKEEDSTMESGKLEEELIRMNDIVENLHPGSLVFFNESFAATNEREGSEIHKQIASALVENEVEVFTVTHLVTFALNYSGKIDVEFLRAERNRNNKNVYSLIQGEPKTFSFDVEIFKSVFKDVDIKLT